MKKLFNILVIIFSAGTLLYFAVFSKGLHNLSHELKNLNYPWIYVAVLFMFMYWLIECIVLNIFVKASGFKQRIRDSFKITMIGQFFNSVTPFASGGQPAQLYFMTKKGVNGGSATSVLTMKLIVYQAILMTYSLVAIIFKFNLFKNNVNNFFLISILGFVLNTIVILFLIVSSVKRDLAEKILKFILKVLSKIHLVKNYEVALEKHKKELVNFQKNAIYISKNFSLLIKCGILTFIQLTVYFLIPYFIYKGFNGNTKDIWNMIAAETFLNMIVAVIPLPGASGGSEGGFYILFSLFFSKERIMSALLLWRVITYYSCIAVGGIFTLDMKNMKKSAVSA